MILIFQLEISRLMCICWHKFFYRYTYFCVSYIIVISDRIGHTLFKHIEFDLNYVELVSGKNRSLCFRTSICRIHCRDQSKTFTLLLKSSILDFETLSRVHVYRIEYVSYRQGPYRIRIDTANDRIIPALINRSFDKHYKFQTNRAF